MASVVFRIYYTTSQVDKVKESQRKPMTFWELWNIP